MNKDLKLFGLEVSYDNDVDLMGKVLTLYAKGLNLKFGNTNFRGRLIDVLSFYVLKGYSPETKSIIIESLGIKVSNLNQINAELSRSGLLIKDERNYRIKRLSPKLIELKDFFLSDDLNKLFMVNFKRS